jgi:hypothetical protein
MSTEIEVVTETAKAVQETGKAVGKAIDLVRDFGPFLNRVVGKPLEDLVGVAINDPLHEIRRRNQARLADRTDAILKARKVSETEPVSPSVAIPLIQAAQDESRPDLQERWARLLANAMDPVRADDIRPDYIETLKRFHPRDAVILEKINETGGPLSPNARDFFQQFLKISQDAVLVSIETLVREKCLGHPPNEIIQPYMTPYGRELLNACRP